MAIQLQVTLKNGQTYNYWRLNQVSTILDSMADPTAVPIQARYLLYKDSAAFAAGNRSDAVISLDVTIDRSAIGTAANAEELLVDNAVIAGAKREQVGDTIINTATGTRVS